jgi:serine/threonine protein kinase
MKEIESLRRECQVVQTVLEEPEGESLNPNAPDLGPYEKATFHKHGLFSTIFKAAPKARVDEGGSSSSLVALKVTTPSTMTAPHNSEREAMILQETRSYHVIRLLSTLWQSGGRLVLVFPFMPVDLDTLMQNSSLQQAHARGIIRDLFGALSHLHSLNIIHRDVKPSNILLQSQNGRAYLADFGIAWSPTYSASEPAEQKITDVGTTSYRPPELLFGYAAYDTSLDLWAAGCTVAEMVQPNHRSIFDAGDLGSELALIKSIFSTLGTPDEELWPVRTSQKKEASVLSANDMFSQSAKQFPDWGKMRFVKYPAKPWTTILDETSNLAVDFVSSLIQYEGSQRMTAAQVCKLLRSSALIDHYQR